ncbi:DUF4838 domain-containing protein [bacterium]|nr:DUF4838 domain-containing protein [bacterium]
MRRLIWTLAVLAAVVPAHAAKVVLAAKGQPTATIVIPANANDKEKLAAADLQHYVKAVCGVDLPLKTDGKAVAGTGLYIGQCEPTQDSDLPDKSLNPEAYALHVRGGNVFFTGRYPTPTYFAVASFLEGSLGVRWFAPGEAWEYVPTGKPGELAVEVKGIVSVPDTSPRVWSGHAWTDEWKTWNLRNKAVLSEVVPRRQFQNNVYRVFPPSKYAQTHPEYYPLIGGKRWIPPNDKDSYWRPCESNPEVQRLVAEYACNWFSTHPDTDSFSVGMDDVSHMCACDACRAWDPHPDSYEKHQFSDRHYKFVNAIAREIAKTHPDRYVGTLIYSIARDLPETVDRLEPNVFGYITETSALWWEPGRKQADHELTRAWAKRCRHLSRYDYFGMGGCTPRVYPHAMAQQLKFDKSLGFEGMYVEVYTFLPNTAPMIWAFARLQWDSKQDVDKLLGEFYARMFGPAAGTMERYFDLLERSWNTPREGRRGWVHRNLKNQALAMSPEDVDEGFRLLRQAAREAKTDRERERIECLRAALQYGSYPIRAYGMSQQLVKLPVTDEASATQALQMVGEMGQLARERERYWAEAPQRQDLLGETLRGLGDMGYLATAQMPQLEQGGAVAALRALAWVQSHAPDKAEQMLAQIAQATPEAGFGAAISAWVQISRDKPPSLLKNGDFEARATNQQQAEKDWETKGAPEGWSTWSSGGRGTVTLAPGKGRNGTMAAGLTGTTSGTYLQTLPVKPGERYLVVSWAKSDPEDSDSGATLSVRFRQPNGAWHERNDLEPSTRIVPGLSDWQPLLLLVTIPDGAGGMVIMPGASRQAEGATALHDDVAVYKLL